MNEIKLEIKKREVLIVELHEKNNKRHEEMEVCKKNKDIEGYLSLEMELNFDRDILRNVMKELDILRDALAILERNQK